MNWRTNHAPITTAGAPRTRLESASRAAAPSRPSAHTSSPLAASTPIMASTSAAVASSTTPASPDPCAADRWKRFRSSISPTAPTWDTQPCSSRTSITKQWFSAPAPVSARTAIASSATTASTSASGACEASATAARSSAGGRPARRLGGVTALWRRLREPRRPARWSRSSRDGAPTRPSDGLTPHARRHRMPAPAFSPDRNQTVARRLGQAGAYAGHRTESPFGEHRTMVLSTHTSYPHTQTYVLKLHRDAARRGSDHRPAGARGFRTRIPVHHGRRADRLSRQRRRHVTATSDDGDL